MAATLVPLVSLDDPRIDPYTWTRAGDRVGREGLLVAEGRFVLRVLVGRGRRRVRSLLLAEARVESVRDVLDELPEDVPAFVAPQRLMDELVGFPIHRGILALAERGAELDAGSLLAALPAGARTIVGLVGIVNHDNVGAVFRNAAAFGADAVLLDRATCDPLYRKAIRVSSGATLFVPFARCPSPDALLDALAGAGFATYALSPRGEVDVGHLAGGGRSALVVGAEGEGLPAHVLARARTVRIPMAPGFDSLNVGVASGIALHSLRGCATLGPA